MDNPEPTSSNIQPGIPIEPEIVPSKPSQEPVVQSPIGITDPSYNNVAPKQPDHEGLKSILSTIAIIILAPLIAFTLTALVFQSYEVDGSSMETTLQNQDRLIVLKVPRTIAKITRHPYIPHRGDVIIFNKNDLADFGTSQKRQLVKRVIGLPGDRVIVSGGQIKIIDSAYPNGFDPDKTLSYGQVIQSTPGDIDLTVPPGEVFVCGDNRTNSLDSRIFGPIPVKDIVGKLSIRIFPFNKFEFF